MSVLYLDDDKMKHEESCVLHLFGDILSPKGNPRHPRTGPVASFGQPSGPSLDDEKMKHAESCVLHLFDDILNPKGNPRHPRTDQVDSFGRPWGPPLDDSRRVFRQSYWLAAGMARRVVRVVPHGTPGPDS